VTIALNHRDLSAFVTHDDSDQGRVELLVTGARCAACMSKIERVAGAAPGVASARFNLTTGKLAVRFLGHDGDPGLIIEALDKEGYPSTPFDPGKAEAAHDKEGRTLALALGVAAFGAGNAMMFTVPVWAGFFGQELDPSTRQLMYWFAAAVATPCALFAGVPFFRSAWASLRKGKANMDVPISIGVILTLIVSFSETLQHGAARLFRRRRHAAVPAADRPLLDHKLRAKARGAARDLLALQAPVATRLLADGGEQIVPVGDVEVGDAARRGPRRPHPGQRPGRGRQLGYRQRPDHRRDGQRRSSARARWSTPAP
jgi:Cu2+-exporting ATPase